MKRDIRLQRLAALMVWAFLSGTAGTAAAQTPVPPGGYAVNAEELRHQAVRARPLGQAVVVTAMCREHGIGRAQMAAAADGDGFLTDREMQRAGDLTLVELGLHGLFKAATQTHQAVATGRRGQVGFRSRRGRSLQVCHVSLVLGRQDYLPVGRHDR